jgi:hypothetical protein
MRPPGRWGLIVIVAIAGLRFALARAGVADVPERLARCFPATRSPP